MLNYDEAFSQIPYFLNFRLDRLFERATNLAHASEVRKLYLCSSEQKCSIFKTPLLESPSIWGQPSPKNVFPQ
jgi:hypothetical protein